MRNSTCLDCLGVPLGDAAVDRCGICDGDGTSCLDCAGVPFGTSVVDQCGLCLLPDDERFDQTCLDCNGVAFGPGVLDRCGVCDGDGTSCFLTNDVTAAVIAGSGLAIVAIVAFILIYVRSGTAQPSLPVSAPVRAFQGNDYTPVPTSAPVAQGNGFRLIDSRRRRRN